MDNLFQLVTTITHDGTSVYQSLNFFGRENLLQAMSNSNWYQNDFECTQNWLITNINVNIYLSQ